MSYSRISVFIVTVLLMSVGFLMLQQTNADNAILSLSITWWSITCTSATGIDLWSILSDGSPHVLSWSAWMGSDFWCTDLKGDAEWLYSLYSSNMSGSYTGTIPASNITLITNWNTLVESGYCPSITIWSWWTLNTTRVLFQKTNGAWEICDFHAKPDQLVLSVAIPSYIPIWTYTSTITVIFPS